MGNYRIDIKKRGKEEVYWLHRIENIGVENISVWQLPRTPLIRKTSFTSMKTSFCSICKIINDNFELYVDCVLANSEKCFRTRKYSYIGKLMSNKIHLYAMLANLVYKNDGFSFVGFATQLLRINIKVNR